MDFTFDASEEAMGDAARRLLAQAIPTSRLLSLVDSGDAFDRDLWSQAADAGWTGALVEEHYGGAALGLVQLALPLGECGRALVPLPLPEAAVMFPLLLQRCGTPQQQSRWLPAVASGACLPTVRLSGVNAYLEQTECLTATPDGNGWMLDGDIAAVPFGAHADVAILPARCTDGAASTGLGRRAFFIVAADDAGVSWHENPGFDVTYPMAGAQLSKVRLGADRLVNTSSDGKAAEYIARAGRTAYALLAVGGMRRLLDQTVEYVQQREQFGRPISTFQAVKHHIANMRVRVDTSEPTAYYAAWSFDNHTGDGPEASATAYVASTDGFLNVAKTSIQLHGAIGYTWERGIHLYLRRAQHLVTSVGSTSCVCTELGRRARRGEILSLT